jgi:hypothetical protein
MRRRNTSGRPMGRPFSLSLSLSLSLLSSRLYFSKRLLWSNLTVANGFVAVNRTEETIGFLLGFVSRIFKEIDRYHADSRAASASSCHCVKSLAKLPRKYWQINVQAMTLYYPISIFIYGHHDCKRCAFVVRYYTWPYILAVFEKTVFKDHDKCDKFFRLYRFSQLIGRLNLIAVIMIRSRSGTLSRCI